MQKTYRLIIIFSLLFWISLNFITQQIAFLYIFRLIITLRNKINPTIIYPYPSKDGKTTLEGIIYRYRKNKKGPKTLIIYCGGNSEPIFYKQKSKIIRQKKDQPTHIKHVANVEDNANCDIIFPARLSYGKAITPNFYTTIVRTIQSWYDPQTVIENDLHGLATKLTQSNQYDQIKIIGFSMGGWQALYLADLLKNSRDQKVTSLILISPLVNLKKLIAQKGGIWGYGLSHLLWFNIDALDIIKKSFGHAAKQIKRKLNISFFLSRSDQIIPIAHSQILKEKLRKAGYKNIQIHTFINACHIKMLYTTSSYIGKKTP